MAYGLFEIWEYCVYLQSGSLVVNIQVTRNCVHNNGQMGQMVTVNDPCSTLVAV